MVSILCGANIDPFVYQRVLDRGLALENRLVHFSVECSDKVGGLAELTKFVAEQGVKCVFVYPNSLFYTNLEINLLTR